MNHGWLLDRKVMPKDNIMASLMYQNKQTNSPSQYKILYPVKIIFK